MATYRSFDSDSRELRQHKRVMTPEGTSVILSPGFDNEWTFQAIDISLGRWHSFTRGKGKTFWT